MTQARRSGFSCEKLQGDPRPHSVSYSQERFKKSGAEAAFMQWRRRTGRVENRRPGLQAQAGGYGSPKLGACYPHRYLVPKPKPGTVL